MDERITIKILDEQRNLIERKILFTFECEELGKNYIAYEGNADHEICVVSSKSNFDLSNLEPITDPEELKMVQDVLNKIMNED